MQAGVHQWRGVIEEYRERLPVTDATPGHHACARAARRSSRPASSPSCTGCEVWLKVEGAEPHRFVQGPRHDHGDLQGRRGGRQGRHLRLHRQHLRVGRGLRRARPGWSAPCSCPQGKIALGKLAQALVHGAKLLQVDGNFDDCLTLARKLSEHYPVALVNSVNPSRIEGQKTAAFEIVDFLGDAPDIHCLPVGNAGNITAYWKGYTRVRRRRHRHEAPARVGLPGRRRGADRQRRARHAPVDHRHRDPHRQPGVVGPGRRGARRVRRPHRRGHRPRDPRRVPAARGARRACSSSRRRPRRSPACCRSTRPGVLDPGQTVVCTVTGHGLKDPEWAIAGAPTPDQRARRRPRGRGRSWASA